MLPYLQLTSVATELSYTCCHFWPDSGLESVQRWLPCSKCALTFLGQISCSSTGIWQFQSANESVLRCNRCRSFCVVIYFIIRDFLTPLLLQCQGNILYMFLYRMSPQTLGLGNLGELARKIYNIIQRKPNLLWWGGAFSKTCPVRHLLHPILSIPSALMLARLRRWSTWTLQHEELWCQGEELFFGAWQNVLCVCISELLTHDVMT